MLVITEALCNGNYTALISASGRIHCTLVVCNSERVTVILHSTFLKFHWSSVVSVLSGCYMAGAKWNCCHLGTCFEYTTPHTSLHCHLIWSHIRRMHVCLAVTCHLHLWQNDWDPSWTTVGTLWWNDTENNLIRICRENWPWGRNFLLIVLGVEPITFWSGVWHSTTKLSLLFTNHWTHQFYHQLLVECTREWTP